MLFAAIRELDRLRSTTEGFHHVKIIVSLLCFALAVAPLWSVTAQAQSTRRKAAPAQGERPAPQRQEPVPAMPVLPDIRNDADVEAADVALIANITIREMRFDAVPNPTVEFLGKPKTSNIWHADRYNLPDQVQPGVTYRNVGIRLKITSRLADIDRIVSEALGEIPLSEDKQADNQNRTASLGVTTNDQKAPLQLSPRATLVKKATPAKKRRAE